MERSEQLLALARQLKAEKHSNELNRALTHSSYNTADEDANNSRYVFLGQFAFRGYVADILYNYMPGSGTQLQHTLGNMFRNEQLHLLFDKLNLSRLIRFGASFDGSNHKHIFVFALLGFIHKHAPQAVKQQIVSTYFLLPNKHLVNYSAKSNDFQAQCNMLSRMLFGEPVFVETKPVANDLWQTTVSVNNAVLAQETSKSHRYSRQKTLKKVLKQFADDVFVLESNQPEFKAGLARIEQLKTAEYQRKKEEKLQLQAEKEERKRTESKIKKQKRKDDSAQRDLERRKAKAEVKKKESRKGKNTIYRDYSAEEIAAMNPAKRRRLEDLGILVKQK